MRSDRKFFYIFLAIFLLINAPGIGAQNNKDLGLKTVVIDPGHGGKDPGAPGRTSATSEKHLVLKISKLLGNKI